MPNITEIYNTLLDDPDIIPPKNVSKEDYVLMLAQQRVKQHDNNEQALNLGLTKLLKQTNGTNGYHSNGHSSAVKNFASFVTINKSEDLLEQAILLMLKKGVPEFHDHLQNIGDAIGKPIDPDGEGKSGSGLQAFYREMIKNQHPDVAMRNAGLTDPDLVLDDNMKEHVASFKGFFTRTAAQVNDLKNILDGMDENETLGQRLERFESEAYDASGNPMDNDFTKLENGLGDFFWPDGTLKAEKVINDLKERGARLKQIKDWSEENDLEFDPNHPDLSVENDPQGKKIPLDKRRIDSYLRDMHKGSGDAPQWTGPQPRRPPQATPRTPTPTTPYPSSEFKDDGDRMDATKRDASQRWTSGEITFAEMDQIHRQAEADFAGESIRPSASSADEMAEQDQIRDAMRQPQEDTEDVTSQAEVDAQQDAEVGEVAEQAEADPNAWPKGRAETNAYNAIQAHLIREHGQEDGEAELQRLKDEEGLGSEDNRPSGVAAARDYVANLQPEEESDEEPTQPTGGGGASRPTSPLGKLADHLTNLGIENARDLINNEDFKEVFENVYGQEGLDTASNPQLHALVDEFIGDHEELSWLQDDDSEFKAAVDAHVGDAAPQPQPEEEDVDEEDVEEEEDVEDEDDDVEEEESESFGERMERMRREAEEENIGEDEEEEEEEQAQPEPEPEPQPEEQIAADVGARWDTVLDPARGGGIRHALMHGLVDTDGNITPVGKQFFDHVGGMYNDARKLIDDNPDQFEAWREAQGYQRSGNPIREDHRLSGTALNSLISQYNLAGGTDAVGKLNQIYDLPPGIRGEDLFGHEGVTPIEDAQIPSVEDMHTDRINHTHVLNAVLHGHINNSNHRDHVADILAQELRDRGVSEEQAETIVNEAQEQVDTSGQPEAQPEDSSPDEREEVQGTWDDFLADASDQLHEAVQEVAALEGPTPEPSEESWQKQRQYSMFENLVSDEQAAQWGLAGDFYSGPDGANRLIDEFNQAGVAARAADGASADKYDIPAPQPEQAEMDLGPEADQPAPVAEVTGQKPMDLGPEADQPVTREPLDEAAREQARRQSEREAVQEKIPGFEEEERLAGRSKRQKRVEDLKEVMDEGAHGHLDDSEVYDDKEIDKLWNKHVRDASVKTKEQVAKDEAKATEETTKTAKTKAGEATKNAKRGKVPDDGSDVKFDKDKAIERLAKLRNPDLEEGSDELAQKTKDLNDYYDPAVGMTEKDLQTDLKAEHKLAANVASQKATAEKEKGDQRALVNARGRLSQYQSPDEFLNDKTGNPSGDRMSPELATEKARDLTHYWHQNMDAFKDTEHHASISEKMGQYIDAGAKWQDIDDELKEMEEQGILGDKDKMEQFTKDKEIAAKKEQVRKDVHDDKVNTAINEVHADRSVDANGNPIHHRMDHTGDLEEVSPEDAGIEHADSPAPVLGHTDENGELDAQAQTLYNDLHESIKTHPHKELKRKQKGTEAAHAKASKENEDEHQRVVDEIEGNKDAAHQQNDEAETQAQNEQDQQHFDRINQLQDDHQAELDQHDANHQATQDNLDRLVDTHTQAVEANVAQGARINENHFAAVQQNLKENDLQNKMVTDATHQKRLAQQVQEKDWNKIYQEGLDALGEKQQAERDVLTPPGGPQVGDIAPLANLKEQHAAEFQQRREGAADQEEVNRQRDKQITAEHNDGIQQMQNEMESKNSDLQQQRQDAHLKTNQTLRKVEEAHLETINEERKKRGEEPLTTEEGIPDIQHHLQQEKGVATEVHTDKRDTAIKAYEEAGADALDEHEKVQSDMADKYDGTRKSIDDAVKGHHQENDDLHKQAGEAAEAQRTDAHAQAADEHAADAVGMDGNAEGQLGFGDLSEGKRQAFVDHMKENGASESAISAALANPNLGRTAGENKEKHDQEGADPETEGTGEKGQTRMVKDPETGEMKQQVYVPGRGKGWCDKDQLNSSTGDNMGAAGGKPDGKLMIYPQGAKGNPFEGAMAGHGGNWHSIQTDNPLASDHPDAAEHDHEDVIAHALGNSLKDHEGMKGDQPFEVDANDHGFGGSEHGATNKRKPKEGTPEKMSQIFGEEAGARAADVSSQLGVKQAQQGFTGAADWLKNKLGQSETGSAIGGAYSELKRDINRQGGMNPLTGLGDSMRATRHQKERIGGEKYSRIGFARGFGPDKEGTASASDEAWRTMPKWLRPKDVQVRHAITDHREKQSAKKNMEAHIDKVHQEMDEK